jgi:hypothetical protein
VPAVYDDQKEKSSGAEYDGLGIDKSTPPAEGAETDELEKLYEADAIKDEDRNTNPKPKEKDNSGGLGGAASFATNLTPKVTPTQFVAKIARSRGGVIGGLVAGVITAVTIVGFVQAPNFIVNHLRETLLGNISEIQTNQSLRYRRTHLNKVSDMFTANGRRAGALANELERKGYDVIIKDKKIVGLKPPGVNATIIDEAAIGQHVSDYIEVAHPLRTSRWKTKQMNSFYDYYKISRKSVIAPVDGGVDDPDKAVNKAIASEVLTDESDVKYKAGDSNDPDAEQSDIDARNEEYRQLVEGDGTYDEIEKKLKDGVPIEEFTDEEKLLLNVSDNIDQEVIDLAENAASGTLGTKALGSMKSLFNPTDILDKICTVKFRLRAIQVAARVYRARQMARIAAIFIKASDDSRRGNVEPKLMNSLMGRVTAKDANGYSIGASPGFAFAVKKKFSKSNNSAFKGTYGVDGKLEGLPGSINRGLESVPLTSESQCRVVQNVAFQIGSGAVELGVTVLSGGSGRVATTATKEALKEALKEAIQSVISKQAAKSIAKGVALEIGFEAALSLTQLYAEKSLSVNFTGQEKGAQLGNILVGGSGTLNKQRSLKAGMVPATTRQYAQAQKESIEWKYAQNKQKTWYERTLDMNNPDSVAYSLTEKAVYSPAVEQGNVRSVASNMGSSLATGLQNISSIFGRGLLTGISPRAAAQTDDEVETETITVAGEQMVTDPAGNLLPVLTPEIQGIDPVKNQESLISSGDIDTSTFQPKSDAFKKHVENCVVNEDTIGVIEKEDQSNPAFDCLAQQRKTQQFKAHLAYLDMQDSVDAALFPQEISESSAPTNQAPTPEGTGAKGVDTSAQQCKIGTDAGVGETPQEGVKIRLCNVGGIKVNVSIENNVRAILDGAKSAGITLGGGSYRSYQQQISLRRSHCGTSQYAIYEMPSKQCSPPTARPGNSMHEWGLAVDFAQDGKTISKGSSAFKWLQDNQATHKLINLPSEAWHWSTTGN